MANAGYRSQRIGDVAKDRDVVLILVDCATNRAVKTLGELRGIMTRQGYNEIDPVVFTVDTDEFKVYQFQHNRETGVKVKLPRPFARTQLGLEFTHRDLLLLFVRLVNSPIYVPDLTDSTIGNISIRRAGRLYRLRPPVLRAVDVSAMYFEDTLSDSDHDEVDSGFCTTSAL